MEQHRRGLREALDLYGDGCQALTVLDRIEATANLSEGKPRVGMNVNLTPELETLVRRKVASGMYTSASEVVREALRLMEEQDQMRALRLDQLRQDVRKGLESRPNAPWDPETIKQQGRARRAATKARAKA